MKKKMAVLGAVLMLLFCAGCAGITHCKADGCDDKVYQDGYCEYHYELKKASDKAKDLYDGVKGLFGN